jgi:hypothetical protein
MSCSAGGCIEFCGRGYVGTIGRGVKMIAIHGDGATLAQRVNARVVILIRNKAREN